MTYFVCKPSSGLIKMAKIFKPFKTFVNPVWVIPPEACSEVLLNYCSDVI